MNTSTTTMFQSQPAVAALNKVQGFDPKKFLRKTFSEISKKDVMYLDLKYKRLWFRLAYPKGRINKTILKITEQIAIIEAKIYLDRNDTEPVSSFIAQRNTEGKKGSLYIEAAQHAAENQALIDAGFGIQFCDISQGNDAELFDPGIPVTASAETINKPDIVQTAETNSMQPAAQTTTASPEVAAAPPTAPIAAETASEIAAVPVAAPIEQVQAEESAAAQEIEVVQEAAIVEPEPVIQQQSDIQIRETQGIPVAEAETGSNAESISAIQQQSDAQAQATPDTPATETETGSNVVSISAAADEQSDVEKLLQVISGETKQDTPVPEPARQPVSYTADMPVEEILTLMTMEEAAAVVVDNGTCNGWTLAAVAEKRQASLKWYLHGYTGSNNILRAGAKLMLDEIQLRKAS